MTAFQQHNEWQDSLADWAEHQHFERERMELMTQDYGKREWQENIDLARHFVDVMPEPYSQGDDQSESADAEVMVWLLKGLCVVVTTLLCVWVIAGGLAHV